MRTSFTYDASGRHTGTMSPGGVSVGTGYDLDGRVVSRAGAAFTLDAGGRIVFADLGYTSVQLEYNGLGALQRTGGLAQGLVEDYRTDALGSVLWVRDSEMVDGINRTKINTYNSATGQLLSAELGTPGVGSCAPYNHSCHPSWYVYEFGQGFDAAGNVTRSYEIETDALTQENTPTETRHYYDAADRLTFSNTMRGWIWFAGTGSGTFSDYRYDALGRRVLTRTRRVDATCATPCDAFIERTVYDGDQVLAEIRSSGQVGASSFVLNGEGVAAQGGNFNGWTDPTYPELFGVVLYAHGLGIDQPVHVLKRHPSGTWTGFTPLMDWRGHYYGGVRTDGSACTSSTCPTDWPSRLLNAYGRELGALPTTYASWYGSLLRNRKDANGLTYLRNRYYDPTTGQFTQPDPIGLAGGLNSYGFAAGDPINYSDPFGLCPECRGGEKEGDVVRQVAEAGKALWTNALRKFGIGAVSVPTIAGEAKVEVEPVVELFAGPVSVAISADNTSVSFGVGASVAAVASMVISTPGAGGPGTIGSGGPFQLAGPFVGSVTLSRSPNGGSALSVGGGIGWTPPSVKSPLVNALLRLSVTGLEDRR